MSASNFGKDCGVCHVGGGQMEYDRDMKAYGDPSSTDVASTYTYRPNRIADDGVTIIPGDIVSTETNSTHELFGDNKAEVDCLMCHMDGLRTGAAWYKSMGCNGTPGKVGPADDPTCSTSKFAGIGDGTAQGTFYDSYNRNIAVSLGYFKQAASAGIGAMIDFTSGSLSNVPASIPGGRIASTPNSDNCAMCHARTNSDSIGLPMEAPQYGGMVTGFGNFFRITDAGKAFDFDEIDTSGALASGKDGKNNTLWNEFGCKTGMGKRSQRAGVGTQDRFGFGICLGCATFNAMGGDMSTGWFGNGVCAMPSVQAACNSAAGVTLQGSEGQWMGILENPMTMLPKKVVNKMEDTDVHDKAGMKCATCHYTLSGDFAGRTISSGATSYTYPGITGVQKMDHQIAQGWSTLEKANDVLDGTVTCESCHTEGTHPNKGTAPNPTVAGHAGFPALHFEKIDCRTCHIPAVYSSPGRLLFRDWTAGGYRQTDGSNGNANHFDFAFNFMEGSATPMAPLKVWIKVQEPAGDVYKISPGLPSMLPMWINGANSVPLMTRDVTAAAALVAANNPDFGIRINGTNEHPLFQGFQLTDPMKIESKAKIEAMRAELATSGAGLATHASVADAKLNLQPFFFDPSHGITSKTLALGSPSAGGCAMCHSTSGSPNSVGFFDGKKDMLKNGMMQMADYDCGGDDMHQLNAADYGNTPGGWSNASGGVCGMFESNADGICNAAELQACKGYIGSNLFPQFGMPADIANAFPIDGIDMMQMQAIREDATAAGCNPIYSFFGFPNAGRMTAPGSMSNGTGPTNGCIAADYYSRDEIRKHYQKNLQQVIVGGARKVFGNIKVGPTLAAFDIGSTCITDPMTGATGPCTDGGYVATTVTERNLLGYDDTKFAELTSLSGMQASLNCTQCHTQTHTGHVVTHSDNATCTTCHATSGSHRGIPTGETMAACQACHSTVTFNSNVMSAAPTCDTCHASTGVVGGITYTNYIGQKPVSVDVACGQCHGGAMTTVTTAGASYISSADLAIGAAMIHGTGTMPVPTYARFTWSTDPTTDYKVLLDASTSTCEGTCTYSWSTGETGAVTSHTFASAATTTVTVTVTGPNGVSSRSKAVTPKYVAALPTTLTMGTNTIAGTTATVGYSLSGGQAPYTIKTVWGDGAVVTTSGVAGGANTTVHTYVSAGTYTVSITAQDSGVAGGNVTSMRRTTSVTVVPSVLTVSGLVTRPTGTPVYNASVTLKLNGVAKKMAYTNVTGNFTMTGVAPGTYTITVLKSGLTFTNPAATVPVTTTNVTGVNISSTN